MQENLLFLQDLLVALLLGGLIGLEREQDGKESDVHEFGIRTMTLTGGLGFLTYYLFSGDPMLFSVLTGGFLLLVLFSYLVSSRSIKNTGVTTEVSAIFVYLIGVLSAMDKILYAAVIALIVTLLLYFKEGLHGFARKVAKKELYDTFKFIAVAFVVLPLLPNQTFGPLDVLNPYVIWLMVVFISGISFISYVAIKILGTEKGVGLSGFLGGLISSTAVSMSFASLSKKSKSLVNPFVFGIVIASSAMFFRILLEISVLNADLLLYLMWPMLAMGSTGLLTALYFWLNQKGKPMTDMAEENMNLQSPFQLKPALQFGLFFAALLFVSKLASMYLGNEALYLTALISGLVDVDAITVSMANLTATQDVTLNAGAIAIMIAAASNTFVKGGIVLFFGSRAVGLRTAFAMVLMILVGFISLLFLPLSYGFA